ncbi:hypothetical protein [Lactiplantibacillus plantarum]|uniref:hypothetical protein n=1 Tax=Lactiplantibacillus plantarum TaxID=1590 RepID=UPI001C9E1F59|nr:hypothetical protein [Lactiplantibacillus plantarum]
MADVRLFNVIVLKCQPATLTTVDSYMVFKPGAQLVADSATAEFGGQSAGVSVDRFAIVKIGRSGILRLGAVAFNAISAPVSNSLTSGRLVSFLTRLIVV